MDVDFKRINMRDLDISQLEDLETSERTSPLDKKVISILIKSMNDWPNPTSNLDNFESELRDFIGGETTKHNIDSALKKIDYSKNSWQAESLSQISDLFSLFKEGMSIKQIIRELRERLV